jgi:hypothetical protein
LKEEAIMNKNRVERGCLKVILGHLFLVLVLGWLYPQKRRYQDKSHSKVEYKMLYLTKKFQSGITGHAAGFGAFSGSHAG